MILAAQEEWYEVEYLNHSGHWFPYHGGRYAHIEDVVKYKDRLADIGLFKVRVVKHKVTKEVVSE